MLSYTIMFVDGTITRTKPVKELRKILVAGESYNAVRHWAMVNGIPRHKIRYVHRTEQILGYEHGTPMFVVGRISHNLGISTDEINDMLREVAVKQMSLIYVEANERKQVHEVKDYSKSDKGENG